MKYDKSWLDFLYEFNTTKDYFECHEILEELWLREGRSPFLQGVLQIAVALYHHQRGNLKGARKLFNYAHTKLEPYPKLYWGIHLLHLKNHTLDYVKNLDLIPYTPFEIELIDPYLIQELQKKEG